MLALAMRCLTAFFGYAVLARSLNRMLKAFQGRVRRSLYVLNPLSRVRKYCDAVTLL